MPVSVAAMAAFCAVPLVQLILVTDMFVRHVADDDVDVVDGAFVVPFKLPTPTPPPPPPEVDMFFSFTGFPHAFFVMTDCEPYLQETTTH